MVTIPTLAAFLVRAMLTFTPVEEHAFYEPRAATVARYEAIAEDVAAVALDPAEAPLFADERFPSSGRVQTGLVLVAIAAAESHYRGPVDACLEAGDNGRALTLWQMHRPRKLVCSSRRAGAREALRMVRESFAVCARFDLRDKLGFYTDGFCRADWQRSRYRLGLAFGYWARRYLEA